MSRGRSNQVNNTTVFPSPPPRVQAYQTMSRMLAGCLCPSECPILSPLLAKGVLVPLAVAPPRRGAPRLLGDGLGSPGPAPSAAAVLEAALGGPLALVATVKLTLTRQGPTLAATAHSSTTGTAPASGATSAATSGGAPATAGRGGARGGRPGATTASRGHLEKGRSSEYSLCKLSMG